MSTQPLDYGHIDQIIASFLQGTKEHASKLLKLCNAGDQVLCKYILNKLNIAALNENRYSAYILGNMHSKGLGTKKDYCKLLSGMN